MLILVTKSLLISLEYIIKHQSDVLGMAGRTRGDVPDTVLHVEIKPVFTVHFSPREQ